MGTGFGRIRKCLRENVGPPAELALPQCVTDDGGAAAAAWPIVFMVDGTAERRRHSQHAKEIARDKERLDVADLTLRRQIHARVGEGEQRGKRLLVRADLVPERQGYLPIAPGVAATARPGEPHLGQFIRLGYGETAQAHGIQQSEHGTVCADAERERENRRRRKGRRAAEGPQAEGHVAPQGFDGCAAPGFAHLLFDRLDPAQLQTRGALCLIRRIPAFAVVVRQQVDVGTDFRVQLTIEPAPGPQILQPGNAAHHQLLCGRLL